MNNFPHPVSPCPHSPGLIHMPSSAPGEAQVQLCAHSHNEDSPLDKEKLFLLKKLDSP